MWSVLLLEKGLSVHQLAVREATVLNPVQAVEIVQADILVSKVWVNVFLQRLLVLSVCKPHVPLVSFVILRRESADPLNLCVDDALKMQGVQTEESVEL